MRVFIFILFALSAASASDAVRTSLVPIKGIDRADLWIAPTVASPRAILILCPGMNGSAESMIRDRTWQAFAVKNNLGLAGLSFASPAQLLHAGEGYTFPDQGSGKLLLEGLRKHYGRDLPVLLYGFSSGALFTELFVAWQPERVIGWCAHATGRFENQPDRWPPGIVSCGQKDSGRYGAALTHFKKGRKAGSPLLWVGMPEAGHQWPAELHEFVRGYFQTLLSARDAGLWVDIDTERSLTEFQASREPTLSGWLPSKELETPWKFLNAP